MTHYKSLYGYKPPKLKDLALIDIKVLVVKNHLEENHKNVQILQGNLINAQKWMKQHANQHKSQREFEEGDLVFVRFQPYKQLSLKQ